MMIKDNSFFSFFVLDYDIDSRVEFEIWIITKKINEFSLIKIQELTQIKHYNVWNENDFRSQNVGFYAY